MKKMTNKFNIKEELRANGGFSVNQGLEPPSRDDGRYMVGIAEVAVYTSIESITKSTQYFIDFLRVQQAKNHNKNLFLGGWLDTKTGHVYIDISEAIHSKFEAITTARRRGEFAIYDIATDEDIYI